MEVLQYHPSDWDKAFLSEKDNLFFLLPQFKFNVEHIGATSIPNCRSFRNIDILLSLNRFEDILTVAMLLNSKDYKEIKEFDELLSDKFLLVLRNSKQNLEVDYQNLENRTRNIIEELLSNIAIDIKEHN